MKSLLIGLLLATSAIPSLPAPPLNAPLVNDLVVPCSDNYGYYQHVYDTDPNGKGAWIEFGVYDPSKSEPHSDIFLVVSLRRGDGEFEFASLLLNRKVIEFKTVEDLKAKLTDPCEIVLKLRAPQV